MILDTNGLSALAEGESGLEPILRKTTQIAVPVIVSGEYRYGIQQSGRAATIPTLACRIPS
jgi:predicted nucleic acid-binding protein